MRKNELLKEPRTGCKDVWNAFMTKGALYSINDIPFCPTTAKSPPIGVIGYDETKRLPHTEYFVHFYLDDYKFDGKRGIWSEPYKALDRIKHYAGIITADFSTYQDMPEPIKIYNTFRSRAFGYWAGSQGISVINNVRWGTPETFRYCFDGIPKHSIVAIGTVASNMRNKRSRLRFERGLFEMVDRLEPHTIIVYGSSNYKCFESLRCKNINIITFPSKTSLAFERRRNDE